MSNEPVLPTVARTAVTLANCGELAAAIFARVAGNDISTSLNGETLTREMVAATTVNMIQKKLVQAVA